MTSGVGEIQLAKEFAVVILYKDAEGFSLLKKGGMDYAAASRDVKFGGEREVRSDYIRPKTRASLMFGRKIHRSQETTKKGRLLPLQNPQRA